MLPVLEIKTIGNCNRRDSRDKLKSGDVVWRENFIVYGIGDTRINKKHPGSDRYNATAVGSLFNSGYRYYSGTLAKTYAFNETNKKLYFVDDNGNTSEVLHTPSNSPAYPVFETIRVSGNDILIYSDGFNGLYTYDGNIGNSFVHANTTENLVDMIGYLDRLVGFEENSDVLLGSENVSSGGSPTNFSNANDSFEITVAPKRGAKLMRIIEFLGTIFLFKDDSIHVLEGNTPETFSIRTVVPNLGLAARRGIAVGRNAIYFLGSDFEVYSFQGTLGSLKLLTYNVAMSGDRSKDLVELINKYRMSQVSATYHDYLFRLSFVETGETQAKMEYLFNTTNETESFTRGNNVSCYFQYDKLPDRGQLVTGRSDAGYLMHQYRGLNWDNQATSPTMPYKLTTAAIRPSKSSLENVRFKRVWADFKILGAEALDVDYYVDTRIAKSDRKTITLATQGETKGMTNLLRTNAQTNITSRAILHWENSKGQSIYFEIDKNRNNVDLSIGSFYTEVIQKNRKRLEKVHV